MALSVQIIATLWGPSESTVLQNQNHSYMEGNMPTGNLVLRHIKKENTFCFIRLNEI